MFPTGRLVWDECKQHCHSIHLFDCFFPMYIRWYKILIRKPRDDRFIIIYLRLDLSLLEICLSIGNNVLVEIIPNFCTNIEIFNPSPNVQNFDEGQCRLLLLSQFSCSSLKNFFFYVNIPPHNAWICNFDFHFHECLNQPFLSVWERFSRKKNDHACVSAKNSICYGKIVL